MFPTSHSTQLVWSMPLAQVRRTQYKIASTCEHCFAIYVLIFGRAKYERKSCLNWMVSLQVLPLSQLIWIYFNFQQQKSLKNQLWFNLIFSEEIIQFSKTFAPQVQMSWNQAHAHLLVESFPMIPRTRSEASRFGGSQNYKTNYLPS